MVFKFIGKGSHAECKAQKTTQQPNNSWALQDIYGESCATNFSIWIICWPLVALLNAKSQTKIITTKLKKEQDP